MVNKNDVISFFDSIAGHWDDNMVRDDEIINTILDNANVSEGKDVLDVACGTGVLIPDYLARNVQSVTAIDISPEMAKIAKEKFEGEKVRIICGDVETENFDKKFDSIVVYNAFPHFPDPVGLIRVLASWLKEDGTLTVAHGMSRERIDRIHSGSAKRVSLGLVAAEELADMFERELQVTVQISDDKMYQVAGIK